MRKLPFSNCFKAITWRYFPIMILKKFILVTKTLKDSNFINVRNMTLWTADI